MMLAGGCGSSSFLSQSPPSTPETPLQIKGFEAFVTRAGNPEYILLADEALLKEKRGIVEMKNIHLTFFKEDNNEKSGTLVAQKGIYYVNSAPSLKRRKNDVDLKGDVVFNTDDGTILKTPEVHYNSETEKIYSNAGFVKKRVGKDQTIIISGKSFITDKNLRHWEDKGAEMSFETHQGPTEKENKS